MIRHAEANDLVGRNAAEPIEQPRLESSCRASVRYSGSGVSDSRPVIATGAQVFGTNLKALTPRVTNSGWLNTENSP